MVHSSCSRGISAFAAIGRARVSFLLLILISAVACPAWGQTNPVPVLYSSSPGQALSGAAASLTLNGTGFVSGTVILVNGVAVPTTYQSAGYVVAQITTPAGASGNLPVQAKNPSPGGGTSATLQIPVATLQITATDPDGTNTGTARLGIPVTFSAANTDIAHATIAWSVQGGGTIAASGTYNVTGTYTPPLTMPSNSAVMVTAYLSSLPALTTSYTLNLINPVPKITSTTPAQASTGGTQTMTLVGSGFVPGTTLTVNGISYPIAYISYNKASVQLPVAANATGTLTLQARNPAPGGGSAAPYSLPIAVPSIVLAPTSKTGSSVALGGNLTMGATVSGSVSTAVTWSVSGGGTISSAGTYAAPATMPTGNVVITAALTSNPSVTASYSPTLTNPVPVLYSSNPSQALSGATASLTLNGNGFVSGTVILVNGVAVPTTYQSAGYVVAQITTPAGASGSLPVQAKNPSPGGGTSATLQMPIATLQVTVTDTDGTNTGTARLGVPVTFSAANTDAAHATVAWSVQGAGTIAASGTNNATGAYTPPLTMPSSSAVTVTAYLSSLPALTTSYSLNLMNPVPTVTSASPAQLLTGGTQTVTLTGSGFVAGTTVTLNGTSYPITYVSYTSASVQLPVAAKATGSLSLQVQNPAPGGGAGAYSLPVATPSIALAPTSQFGSVVSLGTTFTMGATVSGSLQTAVNWSVVGPGSISSTGVYAPPSAISTSSSATIYATLASNPAITASYPITLFNPADAPNAVVAAPATAGIPLDLYTTMTALGENVPVYTAITQATDVGLPGTRGLAKFGSFDFSGTVPVDITITGPDSPITSAIVKTIIGGVAQSYVPTFTSSTISFTVSQAAQYYVCVNDDWANSIQVFANPMVNAPSTTDTGVQVVTPGSYSSIALTGSDSILYLGPGIYTLTDQNPITLTANQQLYLADGAFLFFGHNMTASGSGIRIAGDNARVFGRGVIDGSQIPGNGYVTQFSINGGVTTIYAANQYLAGDTGTLVNMGYAPLDNVSFTVLPSRLTPNTFQFATSLGDQPLQAVTGNTASTAFNMLRGTASGWKVDGIIFRDAPNFNLWAYNSTSPTINNYKAFGWRMNSDGIDIDSTDAATFTNSYLRTFDDLVAVKTTGTAPITSLTVSNIMLFRQRARGIIFSDAGLPISGATINGVYVIKDKTAAQISPLFAVSPTTAGVSISNITFENMVVDQAVTLISLKTLLAAPISGITFQNLTSVLPTENPAIWLQGFSADDEVTNTMFENVVINGAPLALDGVGQMDYIHVPHLLFQ